METFDCRPNEVGNLKSVHAFVVVEDRKPRLIGKCYYTIGHDFHMKPPVDVRWDTYFESSLFTTRLVGNIIGGIHLLSIKNIQLEDRPGDTSVPKVLRKRFGINKGYQYKILVVKKPGKQNQNKLGQDLREFPLHSVRSHIKRYGPDKPLFGKYIGEYLWKAHARGDEKHGVVDKDYEVRGDE
jgi:bifunctional DNA-binding transcriptional regulator/antitoxin component of YhaV-PrlF toxin-antitoxin module